MYKMDQKSTDVLIIGAGGAGLRAATAVAKQQLKVIVVTKTLLGKAHTVMAEGGIAASIGSVDPQDSWKVHFVDTFLKAQQISNIEMVETFSKTAGSAVMELETWGALFDRTEDGKISQRPFGGHKFRRVCHVGDRTGLEILRTLQDKAIQYKNIEIVEELFITKIFTDNNKVIGVLAIDLKTGKYLTINCKSIILASGGLGKMYRITSNSGETTGNGFALALNAGAELKDMEFVQFHPTGMIYPKNVAGLLVTEAVRGEGGLLLNSKGERFMSKYAPKDMELASRDVVSKANFAEISAGRGSPNGGVYLDISFKGKDFIKHKLGRMYEQFLEFAHVDISKEKMEVAPTAHYMMGGVNVKGASTETNVNGLFAAGEIAAGLHGANRLGGNSLSDLLVFGKIAGETAAKHSKNTKLTKIKESDLQAERKRLDSLLSDKPSKLKSCDIRDELQDLMWKHVSIVRNEKGLKQALKKVKDLKKKLTTVKSPNVRKYNTEWTKILDLQSQLDIAEVMISSALQRKESRGAHTRSDYKKTSEKWERNIVFSKKNGRLSSLTKPVKKLSKELQKLIDERLKDE